MFATTFTSMPSIAIQPFYPNKGDVAVGELFGFKVGTEFELHATLFERLQEHGFTAPPARTPRLVQEFALSRRVAESNIPTAGNLASGAAYFHYDVDGTLTKVSFAFGGEPARSVREATASARKLADFVQFNFGVPAIALDRVEDWAESLVNANAPVSEAAYAAAWSDSANDAETVPVHNAHEFAIAITDLLAGAVTTALVTGSSDKVFALLAVRISSDEP
jgi:hypothetical protein